MCLPLQAVHWQRQRGSQRGLHSSSTGPLKLATVQWAASRLKRGGWRSSLTLPPPSPPRPQDRVYATPRVEVLLNTTVDDAYGNGVLQGLRPRNGATREV